jgi:hypothetical protein
MLWWMIGYYVFGLLLMGYMCPLWPLFEILIGAAIWPISLVIGIVVMVRELKRDSISDARWWELELLAEMLLAQAKVKAEPKDDWAPDQN